MIDDAGMGDAGSVPVLTGWLNRYDRPLAAVTQAGRHSLTQI